MFLLWTETIARYGTCPISIVWATNVGFFWIEFSCLVCNIGITVLEPELGVVPWRELAVTNEAQSGGLKRASPDQHGRDQRGRWPLRRVDCYGLKPLQGISVVWATDVRFIYQMSSLTN
ncbi:hypothetical protein Hanom_Chr02g00108051 [Helianthus anomalus]